MSQELEEFEDPVDAAGAWVDRVADAYAEAMGDAAIGRARPAFAEQFLGAIRTTSCQSAAIADYTDARYFVDRATPGKLTSSAVVSASADTIPGVRQCLTATNLAELLSATHSFARERWCKSSGSIRAPRHPVPSMFSTLRPTPWWWSSSAARHRARANTTA